MRAEVALLAQFRVRIDGRDVPVAAWRHRRSAELVKLLALTPGHRLPAEQVVDMLWPQLSPTAGAANLRKAAHLARRALGDPASVVLRGGTVALWPDAELQTDVEVFEAAVDAALRADDPEACRRAAGLYRGDLLPDDRYAEWAEGPRRRLRRRYLDVLRRGELWETLVEEEPLDEDANRALIRSYAAAGNRHAALRQFRRFREGLARELGLRPGPETVALYEEISRGPPATAPVVAASPLEGRDAELARALACWEEAGRGRGGALLVTGEAGIGKTRLCEELLTRAATAGWTTLRGAAREEEGASPLAPVTEALDRLLLARPDLAAHLPEAAQAEIARLATALPAPAVSDGATTGAASQRLFSAVAQLLAAAARERGAVVLIDDVHAADEATLQLLHYLARMARFQPVLLLVAYRREEAGGALAEVASSLLAQRIAAEIALGPLGRQAALAIVERVAKVSPARETEEAIWRLGGANPFYTEELAAAIRPDGSLEIPDHLHEIVLSRVARLDARVHGPLARVSVFGLEFTADEFSAASELGEDAAFECLDAALAAGVIEEREARYGFRHALTRSALERSLTAHRRLVAHRKAAEWLARTAVQPARVAHHLLRAGSDEEAVPWLERAARHAISLGALADALRLVEDALARAPAERQAALLELRADVLYQMGRPEAAEVYGESVAQSDGRARTRLRIKQSRAYLARGDVAAAAEAVEGVDARTEAERLSLLLAQAYLAWARGDADRAEGAARAARTLALDGGNPSDVVQATQLLGLAAHARGRWRDFVRREATETLAWPRHLVDAVFDAHLCLAEYLLYGQERYQEIAAFARDLRSVAERAGAERALAFAACMLGEAELLAGDLGPAEAALAEAVELHRRLGATAGEALSLQREAEAALAQGRRGPARLLLERALALAQTSPWRSHLLARAYATQLRSELDGPRALVVLDEAEAELEQTAACEACSIAFFVAAATACTRAGELERGRRYLERAEAVSKLWEGGTWAAAVREAGAVLRLSAGEATRAARLFAEAADIFTEAGHPLDAARCRSSAERLRSLARAG